MPATVLRSFFVCLCRHLAQWFSRSKAAGGATMSLAQTPVPRWDRLYAGVGC